jgi:small GTP-binding protein
VFAQKVDPAIMKAVAKSWRFKVVMIGDSGVGKTSLVNYVTIGFFQYQHVPTVGSQFVTLSLDIEAQHIIFEVWDTAGQEVYRSLVTFYSRGADGVLVVMDTTRPETFSTLSNWIKSTRSEVPDATIVVFANKTDLAQTRLVATDDLQLLAAELQVELIEGSAKTGENAMAAFEQMGQILIKTASNKNAETGIDLRTSQERKGDCC